MADPTLGFDWTTLRQEVGYLLGYTRTVANWSADQVLHIGHCVQRGYHRFLYPSAAPGDRKAHTWSFLRPAATFNTVASTEDYDAPDAFGGLVDTITIASSGNLYLPLDRTGEARIRALRSGTTTEGRPRVYAVRAKAPTYTAQQKWEILLWPKPDAVYTLQYPYILIPDALSAAKPYPLGGVIHNQTVLESCLGFAEQWKDDAPGVHEAAFMERLRASVDHDRQNTVPATLGLDRGSDESSTWVRSEYSEYEGTIYGDYAP